MQSVGTAYPMEDHMTTSDMACIGSGFVTMETGSLGTEPDLQVLCNRVKVLEQRAGSAIQSDSYLRNRIRELQRSERSLLLQLYQLASASKLPSMQHSQRLDQRLHMLREEIRTMTQEKERGERVWRERLQRCQRQLKAKEEEMCRQSQYFENFKTQLQHKLSLACDREQSLQNRIYTLEKQLLDMTVSAATGMATIRAVRITAGTVTHMEEQDRLPSMRGEGEGEEEKKEERRRQWQPSVGIERGERQEGVEGKTAKDVEGGRVKDGKQTSNEARLQGFIISLQEDLRVLLEREEDRLTEQRGLMEQLHEAQENNHFLGCRVEEMKVEVHRLKLSESSLMEEVEELREENERLHQILRDAANQTQSQSSIIAESTNPSPGTTSPSCSPVVCSSSTLFTTAMGLSSVDSLGEIQPALDAHSSAVPPVCHKATAESLQNNTEDHSSSAKSKPLPKKDSLNLFHQYGPKPSTSLLSLSLTTEILDQFKLNLEESPSQESDALREAYRSLGLGEDLQALQEQRDHLEVELKHTQEQLQVVAQENAGLKLQLRKQAEEHETAQKSSGEKVSTLSTCDEDLRSSPTQDDDILSLAQEDLVQALNHENRALADRIEELLAHIDSREEEITKEQAELRRNISRLEEDHVRLEQGNQEQACLISELTKKTEDDLNTIMELQQKLTESRDSKDESHVSKQHWESENAASISLQNNLEESVDHVVASVLKGEENTKLLSSQETNVLTTVSGSGTQTSDPLTISPQNSLHASQLADQVAQLTHSVQMLKAEQNELTGYINSLREQQKEVALSVHTQTEEKQQLTRTVWGLKEEKDRICQSLAVLKQEREQQSRTVWGLKDEREQFIKSVSGLKEEKEQLVMSLSVLERDKEAITESVTTGKEERDRIMQSLKSLQIESQQLSQEVLHLKQERDKLSDSLQSLKTQRDMEPISFSSKEDQDRLMDSVSSLKEEKERTKHSISCLKQEEKQLTLIIQGLREERSSLQALQMQTERSQRQQLLSPSCPGLMKKTETLAGTGDYTTQRCQTNNHKGSFVQEQSDLMREIEALGAELKSSQEELDKSRAETKRLQSELSQSEVRREEAEREALRLTEAGHLTEETRKDNDSLTNQVRELQSKLTGLRREKTDALTLKSQIEAQYNVLTAQLKAKTVALEELNSEYIALKRGQGSRDDLSTVLVSLRTRYNDIRAKYDALLKRKSQTDLDVAPFKAKLSCLVVKCHERNRLLDQMMKAMHRQGWAEPELTQQVEHVLSDAAVQDYTAAFSPGSITKTQGYCAGFTPELISTLQNYTSAFTPDLTCPVIHNPANKKQQNGVKLESGVQSCESEKYTESTATTLHHCSDEGTPAAAGTLKKNANSPVPTSAVQDQANVQVLSLKESLSTSTPPLSSFIGPDQLMSQPKTIGEKEKREERKEKSSPGSSPRPASTFFSTSISPSRRLSSSEKILNLHEQLQKTLMSTCQAPESRGGGGERSRTSVSLSAPADLNLGSHTNSLPVTSTLVKHAPIITTKPAASNKSTTLFNAVASRSANAAFMLSTFTNHRLKADKSKMTMPALSSPSDIYVATVAPSKAESTSSSCSKTTTSPKQATEITDISDATASTDLSLRTTTNPTASGKATATNIFNMTSKIDGAATTFTTSSTQSAHSSPERPNKSARKSTAALEKSKTARPKAAPAEVRSVDVIRTIGQSSLMIGWERPPLDELGCSNGTFVYGYRVFVDGEFHKSVMSSACTKCILENINLSVPVHISVQTLGSNGLTSNSVHSTYRTSVRRDQH
ncbi:early endosome antigen 1-like isoform X2 [Parambassis ranga]|uniref:Early endosome antigen 1-like isoform X2 n=1 Tax=Parambassis ranga TaxID=210632 RepID=A0A6P7J675_9TELE|nr:early endosome antigen 1-like isoform X2 [Parambassis ranga]